ncbi:DUF6169 family protein [Tunicatimonas pelagia]|uniref:DUF6169 family protein n=1 Tax=Tunicatimonas pelagia TaxID=931531 RepID=UPI002666D1C6|nr:DUF6169 family protein [Tunicatimonas pelagia]WKN41563.1 DUF6169 family protein [Tunicatimonas pelagia]
MKHLYDPRVKATILSVINQFFEKNPSGVLIATLESLDHKQQGRKLLFNRWYQTSGVVQEIAMHQATISVEDIQLSHLLLIREDNPYYRKVIRAFKEFIELLKQYK